MLNRIKSILIGSPSGIICLLSLFCFTYLILAYPIGNLISWDVFGYYLYLPQTFIHHDPGISNVQTVHEVLNTYNNSPVFYQAHPLENGNHIIQYPMGMAILYLPFFLLGHLGAYLFSYPADGFSLPYQYAFLAGYISYVTFAVFLIRKLLLLYYSELVTSIVIIVLFFATNFYQVTTCAVGMPHLYLFVLFTSVLLLTHKWFKNPNKKTAIYLGLVIGLMAITRPTEILIVLIPLLYGINRLSEIKQRFTFFLSTHRRDFIFVFASIFLVGFVQLLYWKIYTGQFLYNSYQNPGEGFDFDHPHLVEFLFSFRKGWFIYTPIMFFAFFGLIFLYRKSSPWFWPAVFFLIINTYVLSSWSCWWYAGSFSQRPVVQSYPVMMLMTAALIQAIISSRFWIKSVSFLLFSFLLVLNIFQTWQMNVGILDLYRMTKPYYFAVFGKTTIPEGARDLLLVNREFAGEEIFVDSSRYNSKLIIDEFYPEEIICNEKSPYCGVEMPFNQITFKDHVWLRVEYEVKCIDTITEVMPTIARTFVNRKGISYKYSGIDLANPGDAVKNNEWYKHTSYYLSPEIRLVTDKFKTHVWIRGKGELRVRSIKVWAYERTN